MTDIQSENDEDENKINRHWEKIFKNFRNRIFFQRFAHFPFSINDIDDCSQ